LDQVKFEIFQGLFQEYGLDLKAGKMLKDSNILEGPRLDSNRLTENDNLTWNQKKKRRDARAG
jgi:hypothetical protein